MIFEKIKAFFRRNKKNERISFSEMELPPEIISVLNNHGFTVATEVQEKTIPFSLTGKNIFCSSETGSGKTLAFLIPLLTKLLNKEIHQALILCPTREIAIQIEKVFSLFANDELTSALVIGGTNMRAQKEALRKYPKVLIATPGRLLDMLGTGYIWLNHSDYVVLDEADRMLDMGFEDELVQIHNHLSGAQQTVLFSATMLPGVKSIARKYADDYHEIIIGEPTSVANSIEHIMVEVNEREKLAALKYLIFNTEGKVIVFFNTIKETSRVTSQLQRAGIKDACCIHSKIIQEQRERIIQAFRSGEIEILLASDVASRGIDIPNVNLVINYDVPHVSEEYIHRVGRTGRAGQDGMAVSFCSYKDQKNVHDIENMLGDKVTLLSSYKTIFN